MYFNVVHEYELLVERPSFYGPVVVDSRRHITFGVPFSCGVSRQWSNFARILHTRTAHTEKERALQ